MANYLDLAPMCFFVMDDEGRLLAVNDTTCQTLGYSRELLLCKNISAFVTLGTRIFFQTHFFPMMRIRDVANEVFITLQAHDRKQLPMLLNARRIANEGGAEIVCSALLIENRNKYENEIIQAKEYAENALRENTELQQARQQLQQHAEELDAKVFQLEQRNTDLQQLNQVLSHHLQEPLRKMLVFISMLLKKHGSLPDDVTGILGKVEKVALQSRDLLHQVQRFVQADMHAPEPQQINLKPLLERLAAKALAQQNDALIDFQFSDLPAITGFEEELQFLFEELLENATKFRHPERPLHMSIAADIVQTNRFRMLENRYRYTDFLRVCIRDNGIGFEPRYKEQIFQLFQKLERHREGAGLGLALCKKIIERHKGVITAESVAGKGTEICCYLPAGS